MWHNWFERGDAIMKASQAHMHNTSKWRSEHTTYNIFASFFCMCKMLCALSVHANRVQSREQIIYTNTNFYVNKPTPGKGTHTHTHTRTRFRALTKRPQVQFFLAFALDSIHWFDQSSITVECMDKIRSAFSVISDLEITRHSRRHYIIGSSIHRIN